MNNFITYSQYCQVPGGAKMLSNQVVTGHMAHYVQHIATSYKYLSPELVHAALQEANPVLYGNQECVSLSLDGFDAVCRIINRRVRQYPGYVAELKEWQAFTAKAIV